jgi:hypothetical protein
MCSAYTIRSNPIEALIHELVGQSLKRALPPTLFNLGVAFQHCIPTLPKQSEIHIVIDDADELPLRETEDFGLWNSVIPPQDANSSSVLIWLVSQRPMRIADCYRYHHFPPPQPAQVKMWLPGSSSASESESSSRKRMREGDSTAELFKSSIEHFMQHKPMSSSLTCRDIRRMKACVLGMLPSLVSRQHSLGRRLNALELAAAWKECNAHLNEGRQTSTDVTHVVSASAIAALGLSAITLAVSSFFCGAVHPSKDKLVFSTNAVPHVRSSGANSHRASVLSSRVHPICLQRLMSVYSHIRSMIIGDFSEEEVAAAHLAEQHVRSLIILEQLEPVLGKRGTYRCAMSTAVAAALSREIHISVLALIPTK